MQDAVVAAKLRVPNPGQDLVTRSRLVESLNSGLRRKLSLISAPAGFGKTTLACAWIAACGRRAAWLSLDDGDNDPARFLDCLVTALGVDRSAVLPSRRSRPTESVMASLLGELAGIPDDLVLVLDDYHVIESRPVDEALAFLLDHLPPKLHLAIATRQDPGLPLARLRARDQLTEIRAADLRFTPGEAAAFLTGAVGLDLSAADVAALEVRTEGWIAGLRLAAVSLRGRDDPAAFIRTFSGSNSFVMDFLVEEVLRRQPPGIQDFLVRTSILERFSGPLCDAVLGGPPTGQETLEALERANLFLVPLDGERRWYRYHHLFADLLRQRLGRLPAATAAELHGRASRWFEDNGEEIDSFHHAVAAGDAERAERLVEGRGRPLYFRGVTAPILRWMEGLPKAAMDARPSLWVTAAFAHMMNGSPLRVETDLLAAEAALDQAGASVISARLDGRIAALRAMVAVGANRLREAGSQVRRALDLLEPPEGAFRAFAGLAQAYVSLLGGDAEPALRAFNAISAAAQAAGHSSLAVAAASALGHYQESRLDLRAAAATWHRILRLVADPSHSYNYEAHMGLARINLEWNDLAAAQLHAEQGAYLAPLVECMHPAAGLVLLARVRLAAGDVDGAFALLDRAAEAANAQGDAGTHRDLAAAELACQLCRGNVAAAARIARRSRLPLGLVRVSLAQGNPAGALALVDSLRRAPGGAGSARESLELTVLHALSLAAKGDRGAAIGMLDGALAAAEPAGLVRLFADEGAPMAALLSAASAAGTHGSYATSLLTQVPAATHGARSVQLPTEALSEREVEVLRLMSQGCSNQEIAERLFIALSTVKGHNQSLFAKLRARRRTDAVARGRELGLLP